MPRKNKNKNDNNEEKIVLTNEQKKLVDENFDRIPALKELAQFVFNDPNINGNFKQAHAIRAYIASPEFQSKKPGARLKTTKYEAKNEVVELTETEKLFIRNNAGKGMPWVEMARMLSSDPGMTPLHTYAKAVYNYLISIEPDSIPNDEKLNVEVEYKPPTSISRLISRVNLYIKRGLIAVEKGKFIDINDIKPQEKKYLEALLGYMNVYRFVYQMNIYQQLVDRELAESTFVRHCWGKDDLQEEEVDRYISLMEAIVECAKINRLKEKLEEEAKNALDGTNEGKKVSMSIVELINSQQERLKEAQKRQEALMKELIDSRSDRLKKKIERTAAFINFFELWRKEESRKPMILLAQARQRKLQEEVKRLSDMDALMAEIYGLDEDTISL